MKGPILSAEVGSFCFQIPLLRRRVTKTLSIQGLRAYRKTHFLQADQKYPEPAGGLSERTLQRACPVLDTGKDEGNVADRRFSTAC